MRLSIISHSAVVDTNRALFAELEKQGLTLQLLVPEVWRGDLDGALLKPGPSLSAGTPVEPLRVFKPGSVPLHGYREALGRRLDAFRPDALYVENESYALSTFQAAVVNRLKLRRPLVFRNNQNLDKKLPPPFGWMERYVLSQAACANVVNEEAGSLLRARGYQGRVAYVPYGVDPDFYRPADASALRRELGLDGLVFGYLGRLVEEKGLHELLEAFARFGPEENVSLLVMGDGPLRAWIEARLATPGFTGRARLERVVPHREVPRHLSALDALVLPSRTMPHWKEQFGRVIIEAMACGVPVIGSDSGEIPHLIDRLQGGLVFEEGRAPALYEAMRRLVDTPGLRGRLRERGRAEVAAQYSHAAIAARFSRLLDELVAAHRR